MIEQATSIYRNARTPPHCRHRPLMQRVAPVQHPGREPGPRQISAVAVAHMQCCQHRPVVGYLQTRRFGEDMAAGGRVGLAGFGHAGAYALLEVGLLGHRWSPAAVADPLATGATDARSTTKSRPRGGPPFAS